MLRSVTGSVKSVMKAKIENMYALALALPVLFTAIVDPAISAGIATVLIISLAIYKFVERQERERGYLNG